MGAENVHAGKVPSRGGGDAGGARGMRASRPFAAGETEAARVHPGVPRPAAAGAPLPPAAREKREAAFGHDFGGVRVHHGGESGAGPIQPLFTKREFAAATPGKLWGGYGRGANDSSVGAIDHLLNSYHALGAQAPTTAQEHQQLSDDRLRHLHEIEHHIYRWTHQKRAEPGNRYRAGMTQLLDSVQDEHRTQVWNTHKRNLDLWFPGRDQMPQNQRQELSAGWDHLRHGTGNITVEAAALEGRDTAATRRRPAGFRREVLANHARILTTAGGRKLFNKLNRGAHGIRVIPKHPDAAGGADALATNDAPGQALATPMPGMPKGFVRGAGSSSVVKLTAGMRDSDATNEDASGNPIASPAWLVYAHELIHALHNQRGGNRRVVNEASYAAHTPNQRWTSAEEHQTIALGTTSENLLRSQHGLTRRKWHS